MQVRTVILALLLAVLAVASAHIVAPFLQFLLAALLLAFVLFPLQRRLEPRLGPTVSALALTTFTVVATLLPFAALVGTLASETEGVSRLIARPSLGQVERTVSRTLGTDVPLQSMLDSASGQVTDPLVSNASGIAGAVVHLLVGLLLLVFLLYYLLKDGEAFVAWLKRVTPLPDDVRDRLFEEGERTTWAVLKGHVFVAVVQGVATGVGLFVVGIPSAGFWTLVAVFLAFLPVIGVAAIWLPAAAFLATRGDLLGAVFLLVYGATAVALIDDYLRALVVDKGSTLHSGVILLGVFGAVYVIGAMGLFVGPIILGLFKAAIDVTSSYYDELDG